MAGPPAAALTKTRFLPIPRFGKDVPAKIVLHNSTDGLALIAEGLLEEGLLSEKDWTGDLDTSLTCGLSRWAMGMTGGEIRSFDCQLVYSESLEGMMEDVGHGEEWSVHHNGVQGQPICLLAIEATGYREVSTGKRLGALNRLHPDLGWQVYRLCEKALQRTVGAMTIGWAEEDLSEREDFEDMAEEEDPDNDWLTYRNWEKRIPKALIDCHFDAEVLRAANITTNGLNKKTLQAARDLWAILDEGESIRDHSGGLGDQQPVLSMSLRLNEQDWLDRISDEYHDMLMNSEGESRLVWAYGFQEGHPDYTARGAAKTLKAVLRILAAADRLIQLIKDPVRKPRKPKGKTLCEIFAKEERVKVRV